MPSHTTALALADARVAHLQGAATHATATAPSRRHGRALALLGLTATAAVAALAPTGALARPPHDAATPASASVGEAPAPTPAQDARALRNTSSPPGTTADRPDASTNRADAPRHAAQTALARQDLRSPDARDAGEGRGTFNGPQVIVVRAQPGTRPALTNGIDWVDASIGAGLSAALLLGAAGVASRRRRWTLPAQ
jgi:hypothetical protein